MKVNRTLMNVIIFAFGTAVGVVASRQYFKSEFEAQYQADKESLHQAYKAQKEKDDAESKERSRKISSLNENKPEIGDYIHELEKDGYVNYTSYSEEEPELKIISENGIEEINENVDLVKEEFEETKDKPYVITPTEFGELENYTKIELKCFSDGVITDENNDILEDADKVLGLNPMEHFGEYEDDSVFVRNDALKCDYQILKDYGTYLEALKTKPHMTTHA